MQDLPCGVVDDSVELRDAVPSFRIVDGAAPEGLLQKFQMSETLRWSIVITARSRLNSWRSIHRRADSMPAHSEYSAVGL